MRSAYLYIFILLWFSSCGWDTAKEQKQKNYRTAYYAEGEEHADSIFSWQGNLDGRYPVLMWYKEIDGTLMGSLFYTAQQKPVPILLVGRADTGYHYLTEYLNDGKISGRWELKPEASSAEGEWYDASLGVSFSASLMYIDTAVTIEADSHAINIPGVYRYYYPGGDGAMAYLSVQQQKDNKIICNIDYVMPGPPYNLRVLKDDTLVPEHNRAGHYSSTPGACGVSIRFYSNFAIVQYPDGRDDCGLHDAGQVDGVYMKID